MATTDTLLTRVEAEAPTADQPAANERIMVAFAGEGAGVGELSWGQAGLWDAMRRKRSWFPLGAVSPLPPAATTADLVDELRFMMGRYQTLRTRLRFDPDGTKQAVSTAGEVALEIFDAPDRADPERFADDIMQRYLVGGYDFVADWPIRMAAVRHRSALRCRVVVICHLATDGAGAAILTREVAERIPTTGGAAPPVTAMEPLEQVRWQRSPAGRRQNDASLRYCQRVLTAAPARRFPEPSDKPQPRYWYASLSSPATQLALRLLVARTQQDSATVLLALFAIAQAKVTGNHPTMMMVLVSNRYRRGLADTISPVNQAVPCAIDVAGGTVDAVVAQTRGRSMAAYKYGYFDPMQFNDLVARLSRERGEEVDTACYFNDRRIRHRDLPKSPLPTLERVLAARSRTSFEWTLQQDTEAYERFFLYIEDEPDTVAIGVATDTHHVSPSDVEACLRGVEEVAVAALTDPHAPALVIRG